MTAAIPAVSESESFTAAPVPAPLHHPSVLSEAQRRLLVCHV